MYTNKKNYFSILLLFAIPAVILLLMFWKQGSDTGSEPISDLKISATDVTKGNPNATVELIEYSDFQCPACAAYYPYVKQMLAEYNDKIRFAYRHFPLSQHRNAPLAARAAEAAGNQGKFWGMHDLIFEEQKAWENNNKAGEVFTVLAQRLGLDMERFNKDIDSEEIKNKVENDFKSGLRAGVNSTPTFFLNGVKLNPNTMSPQKLKEQIDAATKTQ